MSSFNISSKDTTLIFWEKILSNSRIKQEIDFTLFLKKIDELEKLRSQSTYNTGSISTTTCWLLYSLVYYFKPKNIAEVGSFIGKSTFSMALASDAHSHEYLAIINCCDYSNKITFPIISDTKIKQFHKTSSTIMFNSIDDSSIDLIHIDGRLQNDDFSILSKKIHDKTIFVLDDFEGIEKGVINSINLYNNNVVSKKTHLLIYPVIEETKKKFNLVEKSSTAIILPYSLVLFTSQ